ncbi:MAG TPA: alpha/beta hydrolase [Anaerolineales bacterium]|nr:alpha/beta hydrolase [Anaerolineales bacterium]
MESAKPSGCLLRGARLFFWGIAALVLLLLAGCTYQRIALARTREQFPAPGRVLEVEGHLMHIHCMGSGSPTVVIDAGNGSFSVEWMPIQQEVSQFTRVCTYDRLGYGWSEAGPQPRDGMQVVSELHDLLQAAAEAGPYLLVGHSLGGVHVRMFAMKYPEEVAGLVLVDTAHPLDISPEFEKQIQTSIGFYQAMNLLTRSGLLRVLGPLGGEDSLPATARKLPPELQEVYLNLLLDPNQYATASSEMQQLSQTFQQASQTMVGAQPFGDLPLIVLTAGQIPAPGSTPFNEQYVPVPNEQIELQWELARLSPQGEQRVIPESGHSVHLDAPQAVIDAILGIVESLRQSL